MLNFTIATLRRTRANHAKQINPTLDATPLDDRLREPYKRITTIGDNTYVDYDHLRYEQRSHRIHNFTTTIFDRRDEFDDDTIFVIDDDDETTGDYTIGDDYE